MNDRTLDRLFRRFRDRNDGTALAAVFDATARELLDVACHLSRDPAGAEDLVQETFLAAIHGAKRYDGSRPVKGWLYGILWREAAKARRAAARIVEPDRLVERRVVEPDERLLAREVPEAVGRALDGLPRRYREVLSPLVREGRAPEEIARDLHRAPGTVRSQIHRGLKRLRRALPSGLAPGSEFGLVALGPGVTIRGLEALRDEVLRSAGFSSTVSAGASGLALQVSIGVLLMSKATILVGVAILAGVSLWSVRGALAGLLDDDGGGTSPIAPPERTADARDPDVRNSLTPPTDAMRRPVEAAPLADDTTPGVEAPTDPIAAWLARFNEAPDDWRHGWDIAKEIAALPPDDALAIMDGVWPHLTVPVKEQVLKPFVFGTGHPHALPLLHLAATDTSLSVQERAFSYLEEYAFQDFATDYDAYLGWVETYRDRPLPEVLTANAQRFAHELVSLPPTEIATLLRSLRSVELDTGAPLGIDLAAVVREAGGMEGLAKCVDHPSVDVARLALSWSKTLQADEAWLRTYVLPALSNPATTDPGVLAASVAALGRPDCRWAVEPVLTLVERLAAQVPSEGEGEAATSISGFHDAARTLADIGDPAAIPGLIQILANDPSGRLDHAIGYFGLAKLTGVTWQESYDGAWWLEWWDKNGSRLPAEVRGTVIERDDNR